MLIYAEVQSKSFGRDDHVSSVLDKIAHKTAAYQSNLSTTARRQQSLESSTNAIGRPSSRYSREFNPSASMGNLTSVSTPAFDVNAVQTSMDAAAPESASNEVTTTTTGINITTSATKSRVVDTHSRQSYQSRSVDERIQRPLSASYSGQSTSRQQSSSTVGSSEFRTSTSGVHGTVTTSTTTVSNSSTAGQMLYSGNSRTSEGSIVRSYTNSNNNSNNNEFVATPTPTAATAAANTSRTAAMKSSTSPGSPTGSHGKGFSPSLQSKYSRHAIATASRPSQL